MCHFIRPAPGPWFWGFGCWGLRCKWRDSKQQCCASGHCLWLLFDTWVSSYVSWSLENILDVLISIHFHFFWSNRGKHHTCFAGVAGPWHFAGTIETFIARSSTVLWDGRGRHGIKEDFSGWIVGLQLCIWVYTFFLGGTGLSIPFSGKTYSLYSEEMMKWCPSVGFWIVAVDGWKDSWRDAKISIWHFFGLPMESNPMLTTAWITDIWSEVWHILK